MSLSDRKGHLDAGAHFNLTTGLATYVGDINAGGNIIGITSISAVPELASILLLGVAATDDNESHRLAISDAYNLTKLLNVGMVWHGCCVVISLVVQYPKRGIDMMDISVSKNASPKVAGRHSPISIQSAARAIRGSWNELKTKRRRREAARRTHHLIRMIFEKVSNPINTL